MSADSEAIDLIESKIHELELKVYGENFQPTEQFDPVVDSILQADTVMSTVVSGMERFTSLYKRLKELNNYLEMNPTTDDQAELSSKLNVILAMKDDYKSNVELMERISELEDVLDDDTLKNAEELKSNLNNIIATHMIKKDHLEEINNEVGQMLTNFDVVCLEISKSFFLLNDAISKLENSAEE